MTLLSIVAALAFAGLVMWMHIVRRDVDARTRGISHFATGTTFVPMTIAFVSLSTSLGAAAWSVRASDGGMWLAIAAAAMLGVAAVPVPGPGAPPWQGPLHTASALIHLITIATGAVLVSRSRDGLQSAMAWAIVAAVGLFLAGMANVPGLYPNRGWLQRCCFAAVVVWLLVLGVGH